MAGLCGGDGRGISLKFSSWEQTEQSRCWDSEALGPEHVRGWLVMEALIMAQAFVLCRGLLVLKALLAPTGSRRPASLAREQLTWAARWSGGSCAFPMCEPGP